MHLHFDLKKLMMYLLTCSVPSIVVNVTACMAQRVCGRVNYSIN
jgi:hypothetical protein